MTVFALHRTHRLAAALLLSLAQIALWTEPEKYELGVHRLPRGRCAAQASKTAESRNAPCCNIRARCRSSRPLRANRSNTACES